MRSWQLKGYGRENIENDHQLKQLLIVKPTVLVNTTANANIAI